MSEGKGDITAGKDIDINNLSEGQGFSNFLDCSKKEEKFTTVGIVCLLRLSQI